MKAATLKKLFCLSIIVYFVLAIACYNTKDPSFNSVTNYPIENHTGIVGAYLADFLIQILGFGILMLPYIMWQAMNTKFFSLKFIALWIFLLANLITLSLLFPYDYNAGGLLGTLLLSVIHGLPQIGDFYRLITAAILLTSIVLLKVSFSPIKKNTQSIIFQSSEKIKCMHKTDNSNKNINRSNNHKAQHSMLNINLLTKPPTLKIEQDNCKEISSQLEQVLQDFHIIGSITNVTAGPVVTLYELLPAAGTKSSRVIGLANDIARSMKVLSTRIATIPGKETLGIEIPNKKRETVYLREIIEHTLNARQTFKLPIALGKNINGNPIMSDLATMPHLLVAGTTGSGKSVGLNAMIISLLYNLTHETCKFIMVDPKMLELSIYDDIPHLITPVITDPKKAINALKWAIKEMENRYRLISRLSVRNIANYNEKILDAINKDLVLKRHVQSGFDNDTQKPIFEELPIDMSPLAFIVIIIDEMADLMLVAGKEFEICVQRLTQMGRAAGIHMIAATQRPSVDVITGVIKANFPTRISFAVISKFDSRTIIGEQGAEQLLGMGDMLYMPSSSKIQRIHGPFVTDEEVQKIVDCIKKQNTPQYIEEVTMNCEEEGSDQSNKVKLYQNKESNDLYSQAKDIVIRDKKASISYIQRKLNIGYNRAANIIEKMETDGIISTPDRVGKRQIF